MAFTLETGTGIAGANAYIDAAFVTAYLTDRARQTENGWDAAAVAAQQAAIIKATDYIEKRFGDRFDGQRLTTTQGLSIPRTDLLVDGVEQTGVPVLLQQGTAEYAVRALTATLQPDPATNAFGQVAPAGPVTGTRVKAGPVETETTFAEPTFVDEADGLRSYPAADQLIEKLLRGSELFGRVSRA